MTLTRALILALTVAGSTALAGFALADEEAAPAAEAPAEALPTAKEVLDKFRAACNLDGLKVTKNQLMVGTFAMPEQGVEAKMEAWAGAPNLIKVKVTIPGMGETFEGFDGTTAWSMDPMQGPVVKHGEVAEQSAFDADYFASIDTERFVEMETLAKEDFHGTAAYKIRLQPRVGAEITAWYAVDTGLELGQETVHKTPMGDIPGMIRMFEYADFAGMKFPTKMEQTMMGMKQIITIEKLEFDVEPAPDFSPPEAIQELLADPEARKEEAAEEKPAAK